MRTALLAAAFIFADSSAHAADGLYLGAGVGKSNLHDLFGSGFSLDSNHASWKVIAGFRPIDWFSVEANYMDFGSDSRNFGLGTANANAGNPFGGLFGSGAGIGNGSSGTRVPTWWST